MLLFLSRTKLPGRQPSEVKLGSRPRLYNCGLVALEVDRLFQAHRETMSIDCLMAQTESAFLQAIGFILNLEILRVINSGILAGNGKQ